jgi:hypothetical protein
LFVLPSEASEAVKGSTFPLIVITEVAITITPFEKVSSGNQMLKSRQKMSRRYLQTFADISGHLPFRLEFVAPGRNASL